MQTKNISKTCCKKLRITHMNYLYIKDIKYISLLGKLQLQNTKWQLKIYQVNDNANMLNLRWKQLKIILNTKRSVDEAL